MAAGMALAVAAGDIGVARLEPVGQPLVDQFLQGAIDRRRRDAAMIAQGVDHVIGRKRLFRAREQVADAALHLIRAAPATSERTFRPLDGCYNIRKSLRSPSPEDRTQPCACKDSARLWPCLWRFRPFPALRAGPGKLPVVASFSILADFARQIGGDKVEVKALVGPNGDVHVYQPSPADAQSLARGQADRRQWPRISKAGCRA